MVSLHTATYLAATVSGRDAATGVSLSTCGDSRRIVTASRGILERMQ